MGGFFAALTSKTLVDKSVAVITATPLRLSIVFFIKVLLYPYSFGLFNH